MENEFDSKVNLLKAWAIILVVSGHLGISILPMFPTYSFHLALFFFVSGYLFKEKHATNIPMYIKNKAKRLLIPYFWYNVFFFIICLILLNPTKTMYFKPISIKNYIITPFIQSDQIVFIHQLWFITQLFISLSIFIILYNRLKKIKDNKFFHLTFFLFLALIGIQLSAFRNHLTALVIIKTFFSLFFIYLGFFYKKFIEGKFNIFSYKCIGTVILVESFFWFFNSVDIHAIDITTDLYYNLAMGFFPNWITPILTSITGIWISLFIVEICYPYLKNNKLFKQIGENTYHILAIHVSLIYLLSSTFIYVTGAKPEDNIYWIYHPEKTVYFYFVFVTIVSTYIGVGINYLKEKFSEKINYSSIVRNY